jgi:hypothetical protein
MSDTPSLQAARDADYAAWREAMLKWQRDCEQHVTLRDTFAAAAFPCCHEEIYREGQLTGYAADWREQIVRQAYAYADAMLRERDNYSEKPNSSTNHDAAPAARASVGRPRTDKADLPTRCGTGETLSEAEIDALQHVVEDGRLVDLSDYGRLRSLLVRLRPEWEGSDDAAESATTPPRNGALSGRETVPDPDSRVWETPCTPQTHATPQHCSVQGDGSVPRSGTENEPVAWWLKGSEYDTGCEYEYVSLVKESAEAAAKEGGTVTPLYRAPTLTDAEREALERVSVAYDLLPTEGAQQVSATLRGLLERTGGER